MNDHNIRPFVTEMMRQLNDGNIRFSAMYYETNDGDPHVFLNDSGDRVKDSGALHLMATSLETAHIDDYFTDESDGEGD